MYFIIKGILIVSFFMLCIFKRVFGLCMDVVRVDRSRILCILLLFGW